MPTVDDELRCVFAGAGVTSLEPDEFTSVMELLFTRDTAPGMRIVREDALTDIERVLLPLLFWGAECSMILLFAGSPGGVPQYGEEGPKVRPRQWQAFRLITSQKVSIDGLRQWRSGLAQNACTIVSVSPCSFVSAR